jgi:ELWxxDGT repeat protein
MFRRLDARLVKSILNRPTFARRLRLQLLEDRSVPTVFFSADDGTTGKELWKSDGTGGGTTLVKDINPNGSSDPDNFVTVGNKTYFVADDGVHGRELWVTDGTAAGTTIASDIFPGFQSSSPDHLTVSGTMIWFTAWGQDCIRQLWYYDTNTQTASEITLGLNLAVTRDANIQQIVDNNGTIYFSATDGIHGQELWIGPGPQGPAQMVKDINPGAGDSNPTSLTVLNGIVYFAADDGGNGIELFRSDGTVMGTYLAASICPGAEGSFPYDLYAWAGYLWFSADNGTSGVELYRYDPTSGGFTTWDINVGPGDSSPSDFTVYNGTLYFSATDGIAGNQVWYFDLTTMTPTPLTNLPAISAPLDLTATPAGLFFTAQSPQFGRELYLYNAGFNTLVGYDINAGAASSNPNNLVWDGTQLFFTATSGTELWAYDGQIGPYQVLDIQQGAGSSNPEYITAR